MTWKEFKQEVERQGLLDQHEIAWIDVADVEASRIHVDSDAEGATIAT